MSGKEEQGRQESLGLIANSSVLVETFLPSFLPFLDDIIYKETGEKKTIFTLFVCEHNSPIKLLLACTQYIIDCFNCLNIAHIHHSWIEDGKGAEDEDIHCSLCQHFVGGSERASFPLRVRPQKRVDSDSFL